MDPSDALLAGLAGGLAIAMQFGAVSLLLVEASVVAGPRAGAAAGMGVATADLAFAVMAVAAGGAAGAALTGHEAEIRLVAAALLTAIAAHGLFAMWRTEAGPARAGGGETTVLTGHGSAPALHVGAARTAGGHYASFLGITVANPLTIASFAALAASSSLHGLLAAAAFAGGVGLASAAWHLLLTLAAGHAGRRLTPRSRRGLAIAGRLAVLAVAANLALAA